jgi:hypothetical protein
MNATRTKEDNNGFRSALSSGTNVLISDHYTIKITHKNPGWKFSAISVIMTSVYQENLRIFIGRSSDTIGETFELKRQTPRRIVLDWHNLDNLTIGCVNASSLDECNIMAYDDFILD